MSITGVSQKVPPPILPMSWLDWARAGDEYVGGQYRIRLVEAYRWEVLRDGKHLFFDARLSGALVRAEDHYRDWLRIRDLATWGAVLVAATVLGIMVGSVREALGLRGYLVLVLAMSGSMVALVKFHAAATGNRSNPYRRRAPWERRSRHRR
jgi:hypothetical protein